MWLGTSMNPAPVDDILRHVLYAKAAAEVGIFEIDQNRDGRALATFYVRLLREGRGGGREGERAR